MLRTGLLFVAVSVGLTWWACCPAGQLETRSGLPRVRIAADGRTFETDDGRPFVPIGLNYFRPGTGWAPQLWKQFDARATREDFGRMKQLGVTCVRVFLAYGSFFTESDTLHEEGLARFDQLLDIAQEHGIYIHPTGPDHWEGLPRWARTDRMADQQVLGPGDILEAVCRTLPRQKRDLRLRLLNEPQVGWDSPAMCDAWNRWLHARYGSAEKAAQAWQVEPASVQWGQQPPPAPTTRLATGNCWTTRISASRSRTSGRGARWRQSSRPTRMCWSRWA